MKPFFFSVISNCLFWPLLIKYFLTLLTRLHLRELVPCRSVILQGAEHFSFDPREIWDYLCVGAHNLASCGITASRSALCAAQGIVIPWFSALRAWTTSCAPKHETVVIHTVHPNVKRKVVFNST